MESSQVKAHEKAIPLALQPSFPLFQIAAFITTCFALWLLLYYPITSFYTLDPEPNVKYFTDTQKAHAAKDNSIIKTGLYIRNFADFNIIKNNFEFEGIVWFEFDPQKISLDTIKKFTFERGQIRSRSEPVVTPLGNKELAQFLVIVQVSAPLNYKAFPLDNHYVYLTLTNPFIDPEKMVFESKPDYFTFSPDLKLADWAFVSQKVKTGYTEPVLTKESPHPTFNHAHIVFGIGCKRTGISSFLTLFLPLLLIFFQTVLTLSFIHITSAYHFTFFIAVGAFTALINYRFVLQSLAPKVEYLTLSDGFFFLFLMLALLAVITHIVGYALKSSGKGLIISGLYAATILGCACLLYIWLPMR